MKAYLDILKPNELIYPNTIAYDWKQDKVDRPQGHPYYQWLQTNQGEGIINIENKDIILKKNDGILITPFTPHYYEPNQYWTTNFMTICGYGITFFPNLIGERRFFHIINSKKLSKLIEDFTDLFDQSLEDSEVSIKTYHIFLTIRDKIQQQNLINTSSTPIYWEIKKYIDRNYMYKLSIGAISKEFHISNQYLIKIFSKLQH
ncbi:MAG: AraC family ligand binding domain-containing protein [Vagococcus sp.]